tara:strand:+ start:1293 stop:1751 length:459 start_codon:yes stop_codon:yes gene_type:complete
MEDNIIKIKTSWSDEQLEKLCVPSNHKITYDGYEYWWYHKLNGKKWEIHYINGSSDYTILLSFLKFWIKVWSRELEERKLKLYSVELKQINQELKKTETYISISNRKDLTLYEKLNLMDKCYKISNIEDVSNILKISHTYVRNYIKDNHLYR